MDSDLCKTKLYMYMFGWFEGQRHGHISPNQTIRGRTLKQVKMHLKELKDRVPTL